MKKFLTIIFLLTLINTNSVFADTYVKWYLDKNWNYVKSHFRSDADGTKLNNWSTYGNKNPYTWEIWTKKYDDYNNYWRNNLPVLDYKTALSEIRKNIWLEKQLTEIENNIRRQMQGSNETIIQAEIARQQENIFKQYSFFNIENNLFIDNISKKVRYENYLENNKKLSEILLHLEQIENIVRNKMPWSSESYIRNEIQNQKISLFNKAIFYENKINSNFAFIPLENLKEPTEIYTKSNYNIYDLQKWYCNSEEKIENEITEEIKKFFYIYENYINWKNIIQGNILPLENKYNLENFSKNLDTILKNYENNLKWFFKWEVTEKDLNEAYLKYKKWLFALNLIDSEKEKIKTNLVKMCSEINSWNKKIEETKKEEPKQIINKYERVDKILDNYNSKKPWVLKTLIPALENMLKNEKNFEKIELINYIIQKIKSY